MTETRSTNGNNNKIVSLPKLHLNIHNVYSRLYKNAVLAIPVNKKNKNKINTIKRQFTQEEIRPRNKIKFSLKNALSSNNGKEFLKIQLILASLNIQEDQRIKHK